MNCNETKVFFDEWKRMCDEADFRRTYPLIQTCPLIQKDIVVTCTHCEDYVRRNIDKAIEVVREWSDQHPAKTRLSVLLEQYPNCRKNDR